MFSWGPIGCEIYLRESGFDFEVTKITRIVSLDKLVFNGVRATHT